MQTNLQTKQKLTNKTDTQARTHEESGRDKDTK